MEVSSRVWAPLLGQGGSYVVLGTILGQLERLDASGSPGLWQRVPPQLCCAALIHLVVRIEGGESEALVSPSQDASSQDDENDDDLFR